MQEAQTRLIAGLDTLTAGQISEHMPEKNVRTDFPKPAFMLDSVSEVS